MIHIQIKTMENIKVRHATVQDATYVARHMREGDKHEVWAAFHDDPEFALLSSMGTSLVSLTAVIDGEPAIIFGLGRGNNPQIGSPWLLATPGIRKYPRTVARHAHSIVRQFHRKYRYLCNYVHNNNFEALQLAEWLGFKIDRPKPFGAERELFRMIWREVG